ncbi:hypothetical protein EYC59_03830 [Candidatus Saccharibacteria bacterium]|nr:MAG: hypothetical protein EYC59_03830 [Candidatus Saccharibacteria bacterium]
MNVDIASDITSSIESESKELVDRLVDLDIDQAEEIVDQIASELLTGVAEEVVDKLPVVKWVGVGVQAYKSWQNKNLLEKLLMFHLSLDKTTPQQREEFLESLAVDERRLIAKRLQLLIDQLDDIKKARVLAKIFEARVIGEIDGHTYTMLCYALKSLDYESLAPIALFFVNGMSSTLLGLGMNYYLAALGILLADNRMAGTLGAGSGIIFRKTHLGEKFAELIVRAGVEPTAIR